MASIEFDNAIDYYNKRADDAMNADKTGYAPNFADVLVKHARSIQNGDPLSVAAPFGNYFVVGDREVGSENAYTRDGSFKLDRDGQLTTANGKYVMGFRAGSLNSRALKPLQLPAELRGKENIAGQIRPDGTFVAVRTDVPNDPGVPIGRIALAKFPTAQPIPDKGGDGTVLLAADDHTKIAEPGNEGFALVKPGERDIGTINRLAAISHMVRAREALAAVIQARTTLDNFEKKAEDLNK